MDKNRSINMNQMKRMLFAAMLFALCMNAGAELKMPYFFSDNMVLQQNMEFYIKGEAAPYSKIVFKPSWDKQAWANQADANGRFRIRVKTPAAGGPYSLSISENGQKKIFNDVYIGDVWLLTGQSNMEIPMQGYRDQPIEGSNNEILNAAGPNIRWFKVSRASTTTPLDTVKPYTWKTVAPDNLADLSATGWFFAKTLSQHVDVPIGIIVCNYGGSTAEAWMRPEALAEFGDEHIPKPGEKIPVVNRTPTTLYNGMLHPLVGLGIRGCIWYQGESNYTHPERYEKIFPKLVQDWRAVWGQGDFPFYYAQIAPYDYRILNDSGYVNSAYQRDAQRKAESLIPHSGMIVLMDAGDSLTIHPRNKRIPGERFALMALAKTYGMKGIGYASPRFRDMEIKGAEVTLNFDEAPVGLTSWGREMRAFEVAGADRVFHPAKAKISGGKVLVSSVDVPNPVAVRYAFHDYVNGELFGNNGLPVSSFRTDNW
jgi:sialate O-acetylesterase